MLRSWLSFDNKKIIDIPFYGKNNPKFLFWIVGIMIFISITFLSSAFIFENLVRVWDKSFKNGFSIELSPIDEGNESDLIRQQRLLKFLKSKKEIEATNVIATSNLSSMVDVILGKGRENYNVPMPTIIDVQIKNNANIDLKNIEKVVEKIAPGSSIKESRGWRDDLYKITDLIILSSVVVASIMFIITIMITFFTTHSQMVVNRKSIEILNLVGAPRNYVAKQFEDYILKMIIKAGFIALLLTESLIALCYFYAISSGIEKLSMAIDTDIMLDTALLSIIVILINAIFMKLVARITVYKELSSYDVMENTNTVFV